MAQPLSPRMTGSISDDRVTELVSSDDRVEVAYRNHSTQMWRALLAYSGDPDIASDAVAEAFAQALRRNGAIRYVDRWVWRAAFRIAAGELKERRRLSPEVDVPVADSRPSLDLRAALMEVSPKQRASLFLFYYGGYSPGEIARMIGSTQSAVRVHLYRGRKRLAEILNGGSND
ncbi:MAG: RNA polymerase sigma factor [Actinomycetota bacterium]